jgi:hypothetical protein
MRCAHTWAVTIAIVALGATANAQTNERVPQNPDVQTLTVRAPPRLEWPTQPPSGIPPIAPITLGVQAIAPPGPSTFSACPNGLHTLQVPGVDCR